MENFEMNNPYTVEPQTEPAEQPQPQKTKKKNGKLIFLIVCVASVSLVLGTVLSDVVGFIHDFAATEQSAEVSAPAQIEDEIEIVERELPKKLTTNTGDKSLTPREVYAENVRSVVGVSTTGTTNVWGQMTETSCSGTGFVFSEDGYIITNHHVIEGADVITVTMYDDKEYEAKLIGSDKENDVALLKIEAEGLRAVSIAEMQQVEVGEEVIAIGNPLGELTFTMTQGYVSALDREINTNGVPINMLQTDAAINSGNSGGPLFDMNGNVIGITTAKFSGRSSGSGASIEGIGFAIPIDDVVRIVYELQEHGYVSNRAYLGLSVKDTDAAAAAMYNLPVGIYVTDVLEGSCSEKAGMLCGDIIISFDGKKVETRNDLLSALSKFREGDTVRVVVLRAGAQVELTVTLDAKPQVTETEEQSSQQPPQQQVITPEDLFPGFNFGYFR
ncbi:MAG: trypsin-like peptidase domain-containing protein [Oscillospiraceae bacterium]|nr:trypsin-like peptidase domain-containing protein [Oscillospiraceae bacterium]